MGFLLAGFESIDKKDEMHQRRRITTKWLNLRAIAGFIESLRSEKQRHVIFADKLYCT